MPTVFIINKSDQDYSDAKRHGDLVFLTTGHINVYDLDKVFKRISKSLSSSQRDDFIVINSAPVLCVAACSLFARKHGALNLLMFSKGRYRIRKVSVDAYVDTIELEGFDDSSTGEPS